ncbi:hypothetical protein OQA88_2576 [Cercophora sp. LCS_1]
MALIHLLLTLATLPTTLLASNAHYYGPPHNPHYGLPYQKYHILNTTCTSPLRYITNSEPFPFPTTSAELLSKLTGPLTHNAVRLVPDKTFQFQRLRCDHLLTKRPELLTDQNDIINDGTDFNNCRKCIQFRSHGNGSHYLFDMDDQIAYNGHCVTHDPEASEWCVKDEPAVYYHVKEEDDKDKWMMNECRYTVLSTCTFPNLCQMKRGRNGMRSRFQRDGFKFRWNNDDRTLQGAPDACEYNPKFDYLGVRGGNSPPRPDAREARLLNAGPTEPEPVKKWRFYVWNG